MRHITQLRSIMAAWGSAEKLTDDELIHVAEQAQDPMVARTDREWSHQEAVLLAHELAARWKRREAWRAELVTALEESVKLQSHYAELLNMHDGGERRGFEDAEAWIERLREVREREGRGE